MEIDDMEKEITKQLIGQDYLDYIKQWKLDNKELIKSGKCKKLFYENLPRKIYRGKECFEWNKTIGLKCYFIFKEFEGYIDIIDLFHKNSSYKLLVTYNNKESFIYSGGFINGCLSSVVGMYKTEFKVEIGTTFKDLNRDLTIIDRKKIKSDSGQYFKYYKYKCNRCGFDSGKHYDTKEKCYKDEKLIVESSLLKGIGCACCCDSPQIVVEGINDIPTTDPWMVKYFQGGYEEAKKYNKSSSRKIYPICPDCKRIKDKSMSINDIYTKKNIGCNCSNNIGKFPKNFMINVLNQLSIEYISEKYFDWCKYYNPYKQKETFGIYDFYIPSMNLIIEMDGAFHNKNNGINGQSIEESNFIDNTKDNLAKEHGLKVIRIDCDYGHVENRFNYIKEKTINKLNEIFDLSNIDWIKIGQDSERNIVKEICDYWRIHNEINNENISVKNVADIFNKKESYIYRTLVKGSDIGWCIYNNKNKNNSSVSIKLKKGYPICENKQFKSIKECAEYYNISNRTMSHWLNNDCKMPKKFYDMGLHYSNISMESYEYYDEKEKKEKIHNNENSNYRKVICITTGKVFNKIVDGANYYNCNSDNISSCCKGRKKSCGKLLDGTRLKWKYVDDLTEEEYIKYDIENKIKELEKKELI